MPRRSSWCSGRNYILYGHVEKGSKEDENPTDETKLQNLAILSTKYAGVIRELINNPREKAFVYSSFVTGTGTNLFAAILELFGFTHIQLQESEQNVKNKKIDIERYKGNRHFILVTGQFDAKRSQVLINQIFNHPPTFDDSGNVIDPGNNYGEYVQVIVASGIVGEGVSFKGARQFHNVTPSWNETQRSQAQGRIVRAFAHEGFPINEKYVKIFNWCAMPDEKFPSIDFKMYKFSENKDHTFKQIERMIKEASVDCALNARRNMRPDLDQDGSRECDYSKCVYECDDIPYSSYNEPFNAPALIEDSYNLFYAKNQIEDIKSAIRNIFRSMFACDFSELIRRLPESTNLILIRALKEIIDQSEPIMNKYGIVSYLRESNNFYFLVDNQEFMYTSNLYLLAYYNEHPVLRENMSFADYIDYFEVKYLPDKMDKLSNLDISNISDQDLLQTFESMNVKIQEQLLEGFIDAEYNNIKNNVELRNKFLRMYDKYINYDNKNVIVSSLLVQSEKLLRCYNTKDREWSDCSDEEIETFKTRESEREGTF